MSTTPAPAPSPARAHAKAKEGPRADAQRERILGAARQCFIDKGFHGASMGLIADTAAMSPGLMYRYFPSKNAIVLAIIERQLEHSRKRIQQLEGSADMASAIVQSFRQWREGDPAAMHGALFLETSAEGSRDAQIGAALRASDRQTRGDLLAWFAPLPPGRGDRHAEHPRESHAVLMQCLIEGLAVRVIREPDLDLDALEPALRQLIGQLLQG